MPQIVVDVPEELKSLAGPLRDLIGAATVQLAQQRTGRIGYESFERDLERHSAAIEREVHQSSFRSIHALGSWFSPPWPAVTARTATARYSRSKFHLDECR